MNAKEAGENSLKYITENNRMAWLNLFADNAVILDPAGKSQIDPTGKGHQGRGEISQFFDSFIKAFEFTFDLQASIPSGNECSIQLLVTYISKSGNNKKMNVIVVYAVNAEGLIDKVKMYWRFNELMKNIAQGNGEQMVTA